MTRLLEPIRIRSIEARNRIVISPMCQYSADHGCATHWHLVHLGKFALGGAGIVFAEATAVEERGRISHTDLGLWSDDQIEPLKPVTAFLRQYGAVPAIQLSHAGRKAGAHPPWKGAGPLSAEDSASGLSPWPTIGPSAIAASGGWPVPAELSSADIAAVIEAFAASARRAHLAGFDIVEVHGGHGYLLHQFLSPMANRRTDRYGGDLAGRMCFVIELVEAVRATWPQDKPLFYRASATDGSTESWTIEDSIALAKELKPRGVDVIDCSSGGIGASTPTMVIPRGFGFQAPYAERIRREVDIRTMAVGLIIDPRLAASIVDEGRADLVAIGREALADPNWPLHAAAILGSKEFKDWPTQYKVWLERRAVTLAKLATAADS